MKKFDKKGVEMTTNTVIIIILVLLVLVALVFFLTRGLGSWNKGTECPVLKGAKCMTACNTDYPYPMPFHCPTTANPACCSANPTLSG